MFFIVKDEQKRAQVIQAIQAMSLNKAMCVEVKEYRKNRSNSQNRLMWSWINIIADFVGETAENVHESFKQKLLGTVRRKIMGDEITLARSTTALTTTEFTEYLERIEQAAHILQINLPRPDDYWLAIHGKDS